MRTFTATDSNESTRIQPAPSFRGPAGVSAPVTRPIEPPRSSEARATDPKIAVLGPTLLFKGELSAEEDFILEGRIEGSINHTQSVTIGTQGSCEGNIHARKITIDGTVDGDLHATESVIVSDTGSVTGNIFSPKVAIVDGAYFNGRIDMGEARSAGINKRRQEKKDAQAGVPLSSDETERLLHTHSAVNV
jgi:cytoskeletal protein CcmA (bactofilin family)